MLFSYHHSGPFEWTLPLLSSEVMFYFIPEAQGQPFNIEMAQCTILISMLDLLVCMGV